MGARKTFDWNGYAAKDYQGIADWHVADAKAWGWNAIRLNILASNTISWSYAAVYGFDALFTYVDSLVKECASQRIVGMLDMHDGLQIADTFTPESNQVEKDVANFLARTAVMYKTNPYVWFSLANEPPYINDEWYKMSDYYANIVRSQGVKNIIVLYSPVWGQDIGSQSP